MTNVDDTKDELEKILNGDEYLIYQKQSTIFSIWWEKVKNWIAEQLENLFPSLAKASSLAEPILVAIIVIVLILIGVATFLIIRNRRQKRKVHGHTPLQSMKEMDWSYQMHVNEALIQENSGNFSPATRHLFLALLLYSHEKGWLEARIWKTNWEYYEELKQVDKQLADQFYHHAYFFDAAMYGEQEVQKEAFLQFRTEVMRFLGDLNA